MLLNQIINENQNTMNKTIIILLGIFICFFEQTVTAQSQQRNLYTATAQELFGTTDWDSDLIDSYLIRGVQAGQMKTVINELWQFSLAQFHDSDDKTIFNCAFDSIYGIEVDRNFGNIKIYGTGTKEARFAMTDNCNYNSLTLIIGTEKKSKHEYTVTVHTFDEDIIVSGKNLPSWSEWNISKSYFDDDYDDLQIHCSVDKKIWREASHKYLFGIIEEVGKNRPAQMLGLK